MCLISLVCVPFYLSSGIVSPMEPAMAGRSKVVMFCDATAVETHSMSASYGNIFALHFGSSRYQAEPLLLSLLHNSE